MDAPSDDDSKKEDEDPDWMKGPSAKKTRGSLNSKANASLKKTATWSYSNQGKAKGKLTSSQRSPEADARSSKCSNDLSPVRLKRASTAEISKLATAAKQPSSAQRSRAYQIARIQIFAVWIEGSSREEEEE